MRPIGYSTGAIALGHFEDALTLLKGTAADAVELSALRVPELDPLIARLDTLDLGQYSHVSIHAPSRFDSESDQEACAIAALKAACTRGIYVVVHPDAMRDAPAWAALGPWLCIENMDKRKETGRTVEELNAFFALLPMASLCFDMAHARQVDGSMLEAYRILSAFSDRIRQVHVSEVNTESRHISVSDIAAADFRQIASLIPSEAAAIIEAPTGPGDIARELETTRQLLNPASEKYARVNTADLARRSTPSAR